MNFSSLAVRGNTEMFFYVMAAAVCLVLLMAYHLQAFGSVFRTGYWFTGEQNAFSLGIVWRNAPLLLHHLNDLAIFMLFPIAILGWGAFAVRRKWDGLVLAFWVLAMYAAYVGFYWAPPGGTMYVRFQISALAAYAAAAMFFLAQGFLERRMRMVALAAWVIPVIIVHTCNVNTLLFYRNRAVAEIVQRMEEIVPPDAVIFVDGPAEENLQASQNYLVYKLRMFHPSYTQPDWSLNPRGLVPVWQWAPRRQTDRRQCLVEYFSKDTKQLTEIEQELVARRLREGRSVFFLTENRAAQGALGRLGPGFINERVAEWESTYPWPADRNYKPVWQVNRIRLAGDSDPKSTVAAPPG